LLADRLDEDTGNPTGVDVPLALNVGATRSGRGLFAATSDVLVYASANERARRMVWLDMQGAQVGTVADSGDYWQVRLAPDDNRLAVTARDPLLRSLDVLMVPVTTAGPSLRLTTSVAADTDPTWSPDGREVAFRSMQRGRPEVLATRSTIQPGKEEPAWQLQTDGEVPTDWRGAELLIQRRGNAGFDLIRVNPTTGETRAIAETTFNETDARWSPDGQWIAYVSDEPGQPDIYLTGGRGERQRVSLSGGTRPRWTADGQALLFLRGSTVMRVARTAGRFAAPQPLFELPGIRDFDTAHRSNRIIALLPAENEPVESASVVLNWRSLLLRVDRANRRRAR
jgi:Tol biopolymer transport system component